ncbi:phosphatase PAP2 family protein [Rhodococcus sp. 077-4]|uniref:phosphatase PAP2 family protein n=1 Tax=Rhodococcus sp. 077-4 TaxID=2789271 RepID=UPI0039F61CB6
MLHSSSISVVHTAFTEVLTESATAETELTALAIAAALVLGGIASWTRSRNRATALTGAGSVLALTILAVSVHNDGWLTAVDGPVTGWFVGHRTPTLDSVAIAITNAGGPPETAAAGLLIAALLVWRTKRYAPALVLLGTVVAASIACTVLKYVVGRDRPPVALHLVAETDHSFPSGHVTGTASLLLMTALVLGARTSPALRWAMVAAAVAFTMLVAATRLYLGVHWLSDVAAGFVLATLAAVVGSYALHQLDSRLTPRHSTTRTTTPSMDVTA